MAYQPTVMHLSWWLPNTPKSACLKIKTVVFFFLFFLNLAGVSCGVKRKLMQFPQRPLDVSRKKCLTSVSYRKIQWNRSYFSHYTTANHVFSRFISPWFVPLGLGLEGEVDDSLFFLFRGEKTPPRSNKMDFDPYEPLLFLLRPEHGSSRLTAEWLAWKSRKWLLGLSVHCRRSVVVCRCLQLLSSLKVTWSGETTTSSLTWFENCTLFYFKPFYFITELHICLFTLSHLFMVLFVF